jgi:hypothetical protein
MDSCLDKIKNRKTSATDDKYDADNMKAYEKARPWLPAASARPAAS